MLILINRLCGLVLPASTKYIVDDIIGPGRRQLFWPILGGLAGALSVQAATSSTLTRLLSVEAHGDLLRTRFGRRVERRALALAARSGGIGVIGLLFD